MKCVAICTNCSFLQQFSFWSGCCNQCGCRWTVERRMQDVGAFGQRRSADDRRCCAHFPTLIIPAIHSFNHYYLLCFVILSNYSSLSCLGYNLPAKCMSPCLTISFFYMILALSFRTIHLRTFWQWWKHFQDDRWILWFSCFSNSLSFWTFRRIACGVPSRLREVFETML